MGVVRCFIAVFLDPSLRPSVVALQKKLAQSGADVKWVEPENLHFTLQFLGDVEDSRLPRIGRILEECVRGIPPFALGLGGLGAFPRPANPRVIWVGIGAGRDHLVDLTSVVEEAMKTEGFRRDSRGISPHLTIGRVRSPRNLGALERRIAAGSPIEGTMKVDRIQLTSSELSSRGSTYAPVRIVPLV